MVKTITLKELERSVFLNRRKMPQVIQCNGKRYRWVGIGWVCEGKPNGKETKVIR